MGYLDAEINPKLTYRDNGTLLDVDFEIKEGGQYLVGDTSIKGDLVYPEKDIKSKITMKKGKPLRLMIVSSKSSYFVDLQIRCSLKQNATRKLSNHSLKS